MGKLIDKKKTVYPVGDNLLAYLNDYDRQVKLPVSYGDLLRHDSSVALYDTDGNDTLWSTVGFQGSERDAINKALVKTYAIIKSEGDVSVMDHLVVDRIDLCLYGNTRPFRVRIINTLNENFDYFYVKRADASRVYGLELEHLLSPERIGFVVDQDTIIEDHIYGIPGDVFIARYMDRNLNEVRLAKEFVKFNERSFVRLLGDMHASNFVIDITVDFESNMYRIRAIDFDQQSYEGSSRVYLPQYFKQNNPIIELGTKHLTWESVRQYQLEERALMHKRIRQIRRRLNTLLGMMERDRLAPKENVQQLASELGDYYQSSEFERAGSMGELVRLSLNRLSQHTPATLL